MKIVLSENQYKRLIEAEEQKVVRKKSTMELNESKIENFIQKIIDKSLQRLQNSTEEMGLGEMDVIDEIESIEKIEIDRIVNYTRMVIYVKLFVNSQRTDFDNVMAEINYAIQKYIPNSFVQVDDIVDNRTFGPGIDW
jgi:hypothetical protein